MPFLRIAPTDPRRMTDHIIELQRTLSAEVSVSGVGLHTGVLSTLTFRPAEPDHGIAFRRVDLPGMPVIPADIDHVVNTSLRTVLGCGEAVVNTVEHVLAALGGLGIDNALVDVDAEETPGADGSALPFVKALVQAGMVAQDRPRRYWVLDEPLHYQKGEILLQAEPSDELRLTMTIAFDHPVVGTQQASLAITPDSFARDVAPARTFGFLAHMRRLLSQGIIQGVSLENSIVIGDDFILNDGLRFPDEFVRHKILDLLGDLTLLGRPLRGHITAVKTGHASHVAFAHRITRSCMVPVPLSPAALAVGSTPLPSSARA